MSEVKNINSKNIEDLLKNDFSEKNLTMDFEVGYILKKDFKEND